MSCDAAGGAGLHRPFDSDSLVGSRLKHAVLSWVVAALLFAASSAAQATIINASSPSLVDVRVAITSATNGDTVAIPAGTATWTSTLSVSKNITIQGAGQNATYINDNVPKQGGGPTTIMMRCTGITGNFRVTGFTVRGMAQDPQGYNKGTIVVNGSSHSVRIDHIRFDHPGTSAIQMTGSVWGVVDHCYFDEPNAQMGVLVFHYSWGGTDHGDGSWEDSTHLGSGEGVYIEDCTFTGTGLGGTPAADACYGGRLVFRHNSLINQNVVFHGTDSTNRARSVRSYEIYDNDFYAPDFMMDKGVLLRGGTGVIWGNTFRGQSRGSITGYKNAITCEDFRSETSYQPWTLADGHNPWDENSDQYGYKTLDQPGTGFCLDQVRGNPPINQRTGNAAWPRQQSEPIYVWSNNWTPVPNNPGALINPVNPTIQIGRDIINNGKTPKPGYVPYTYPHPITRSLPPYTAIMRAPSCKHWGTKQKKIKEVNKNVAKKVEASPTDETTEGQENLGD